MDERNEIKKLLDKRFSLPPKNLKYSSQKADDEPKEIYVCELPEEEIKAAKLLINACYQMGRSASNVSCSEMVSLARPYADAEHAVCSRPPNNFSEDFETSCQQLMLLLLERATGSILVSTFELTVTKIVVRLLTLLVASGGEVDVRVIVDKKQLGSDHARMHLLALHMAGCIIKVDCSNDFHHNKLIVLDNEAYLTGSYNLSDRAETVNAENFVVGNTRATVASFRSVFEMHWIYLSRFECFYERDLDRYWLTRFCTPHANCLALTYVRENHKVFASLASAWIPTGPPPAAAPKKVAIPVFARTGRAGYTIESKEVDEKYFSTLPSRRPPPPPRVVCDPPKCDCGTDYSTKPCPSCRPCRRRSSDLCRSVREVSGVRVVARLDDNPYYRKFKESGGGTESLEAFFRGLYGKLDYDVTPEKLSQEERLIAEARIAAHRELNVPPPPDVERNPLVSRERWRRIDWRLVQDDSNNPFWAQYRREFDPGQRHDADSLSRYFLTALRAATSTFEEKQVRAAKVRALLENGHEVT